MIHEKAAKEIRKIRKEYNINNILISALRQDWKDIAWVNVMRSTLTYDGNNNLTSELYEWFNGSMWELAEKHTYTYDANSNQTSLLYQNWNGSAWVNFQRWLNTFDINNFPISDSYIVWSEFGTGGDSTHYYFKTVLGVYDLTMHTDGISVYPNPNSGKFTVISNSTLNSIEIYTILGKLIYSRYKLNQKSSTEIELSDCAKGIYFCRLMAGSQSCNGKIIVEK